jgi:enolase
MQHYPIMEKGNELKMIDTTITQIEAIRVWDSRGRPTVEAIVYLVDGSVGHGIAPAGASTGSNEAIDLRDGGKAFGGYDVQGALSAVNGEISMALRGLQATDQTGIDKCLIELDGTVKKGRLGGNATIAVSMAVVQASANAHHQPLWRYLGGNQTSHLYLPEIQIFGGGAHADSRIDIQDFMVVAIGAKSYVQALEWTAEVYMAAGKILAERGLLMGLADEGGYWPAFKNNSQGLDLLVLAIERAGFVPGEHLAIALDVAASEFGKNGQYHLALEDRNLDSDGMCAMMIEWVERYPICSLEDPLGEDDREGMKKLTDAIGYRVQIVGDDYLTTNADRVNRAAAEQICNSVLIKPNQAGTLTEAKAAFDASLAAGWTAIISGRSGETEDATICHLAVAWGVPQLKVGSFARSERMIKWNEGLRIAHQFGNEGMLVPRNTFPW